MVLLQGRLATERSQKALVHAFLERRADTASRLVYFPQRPHSAEFYSGGKAVRAADAAALQRYLGDATADFFAIREQDFDRLPEADRIRLDRVGTYGEYRLLREGPR
jgi:hypothetical protein